MIKKLIWAVIASIFAIIAFAWFTQDEWLPKWNQELADQSIEFRNKGLAYGEVHEQSACLSEGAYAN